MSEYTSEPPTQDLKHTQGEETKLPRDRHWATMVSLYPDDFSVDEYQEAQEMLAQEGLITDVHDWPLSKVRLAQERPYTSYTQAPILSDHARSTLLEAASASVERQRIVAETARNASGFRARLERWFTLLFREAQVLVWTAFLGVVLIGLWNYQAGLDSAPSVSDLPMIAPEEVESTEVLNQGKPKPGKDEAPLDLYSRHEQELSSTKINTNRATETSNASVKISQNASLKGSSTQDSESAKGVIDTQQQARPTRRGPQSRAPRKRKTKAKKSRPKPSQKLGIRKSKRSSPRLQRTAERSRATLDPDPSKSQRTSYAPPIPEPSASTLSPRRATLDQVPLPPSEINSTRSTAKGSGMFGRARLPSPAARRDKSVLSQGQIQRVIRKNQRRLKACDSLFKDRVTVRWTIMASGKVKQVKVQGRPRSSALAQCIASKIKQWRFPGSSAPQQVKHTFRHQTPKRLQSQESESQSF